MSSGARATMFSLGHGREDKMLRKHRSADDGARRMWRKPVTEQLANELDASGSHKLAAVVREAIARGSGQSRRPAARQ